MAPMRAFAAFIGFVLATSALASTPYVRSLDGVDGFNSAEVRAIAQDARGYLWFATDSGLVRFDGQLARRFAPRGRVCGVTTVSVDELGAYAHDSCGRLFSVDGKGRVEQLLSDHPGPVRASASVGSRRYAVLDQALVELRAGQSVPLGITVTPEAFEFPRLHGVRCGVVLSSAQASWLLRDDAAPRRLRKRDGGDIGSVVAAAGCGGEPLALLTHFPGNLYRAGDGATGNFELLHGERNRGIGLAYRGSRLWASYDVRLLAFDDGAQALSYEQSRELPSGGPLLVDAENSLWLGSLSRLLQLPEPDAQRFDTADGLVSAHAYAIVSEAWRGADAVLAITWQGAHRLRNGKVESDQPISVFGTACSSAQHSWYLTDGYWQLDSASGTRRHPRAAGDDSYLHQCVQHEGRDFAATDLGLFRRKPDSAEPELLRAAARLGAPPGVSAVAVHAGRLWLARGDELCDVDLARPEEQGSCRRCPEGSRLRSLLSHDAGLYAAAPPLGVVRIDTAGCQLQLIEDDTLGLAPAGLSPAHRGGFWVYGNEAVQRVVPVDAQQLRVVERIGRAQGLTQAAAVTLLDSSSATWVGNTEGYTRLARSGTVSAPVNARLAELRASADGLPLIDGQQLAVGTRVVELNFAGLSYKSPEALRYRHRINGRDWSTASTSSSLTLTGVQPGEHVVEVAFQPDRDQPWSAPERLSFSVSSPWQATSWGQALIAMLVLSAPTSLWWLRRGRLRLLQRQRTEIAADLHDELGSELASVRVLSSLLQRPDVSESERRALIDDLQESSDAAAGNLRSLVEHMKTDSTLRQLLTSLNQLADRLCGSIVQTHFDVSSASGQPLRPGAARQLTLFWREVLSNVARHAGATAVFLHASVKGSELVMQCRDNGIGFDPALVSGNGLGHLRERSRRIGAKLLIDSAPGRGTVVRLRLPLQ